MKLLQRIIHWFLPSELHFFDFTDQAADATERAGRLLAELARAEGRETQLKLVNAISDCEHEADDAMSRMSEALQQTFVTPIDREDLYLLVSSVENITDFIAATANQLSVHNLWEMPKGTQELADIVAKATAEIKVAVTLLRNDRSSERIRKAVKDIGYMEHESDVIFRLRVGDLFANEKNAIELIKIKEFLEGLEDTVDRCQSAAKVLETIAIKHG